MAEPKERTNQKKNKEQERDWKSIRTRLLLAFLLFAMILMAGLWVLQTVFLQSYYEMATERKVSAMLTNISSIYANTQRLDINEFCDTLGTLSNDNDIFFYVEAADGSFTINSLDFMSQGRFMTGGTNLLNAARKALEQSGLATSSFTIGGSGKDSDDKILVNAMLVESKLRPDIYLYSISRLSPLDSAISILASQLLLVTLASIVIGAVLATWYSKRVARPIQDIRNKAKELGEGNYDVQFEGGHYSEIQELADTLNNTAEDLKRSDALQKDLMANVSHDLRTPLTMIKSYAELIRDISGDDKERRDEHLGVIVEETDRLSELVGDILLLSRIQAGTEHMEKREFEIQESAAHVLATYRVLEENEDFIFNFNDAGGKVIVEGDERKLQQVFSNLISNAVRYSTENREITINFFVEADGRRVRCEVRDKGIGIAEEDQEKIWNRYQKASKQGARAVSGGTGLGLSIAREVLEHHDAEYGVESKEGEGSCFWFTLPCKFIAKE